MYLHFLPHKKKTTYDCEYEIWSVWDTERSHCINFREQQDGQDNLHLLLK